MSATTVSSSVTASPPAALLRMASDERLARLAAAGSEAAFAAIFERHHQALHRYCHSILGNGHDAADALQNTMVKALRALPGERRTIALRPWLYRIAHNESISLLRARRHDSELDTASAVSDHAADSALETREQLRTLTGDLGELTEQQRGALLLRELAGLDFAEVAATLTIGPAAAKQSVYEARRALQALAEGRAMDCDLVCRTLSDGDKRTARAIKMRGHLRACAGCREFEAALRRRPAQLAAIAPALPAAAGAAMLHGLLGGGAHGGGGVLAGATGATKIATGLSLTAKVATIAVIGGVAVGGAAYVAPGGGSATVNDGATHPSAHGRGATASPASSSIAARRSALSVAGTGAARRSRHAASGTPRDRAAASQDSGPAASAPATATTPPATGRPAGLPAAAAKRSEHAATPTPAGGRARRPSSTGRSKTRPARVASGTATHANRSATGPITPATAQHPTSKTPPVSPHAATPGVGAASPAPLGSPPAGAAIPTVPPTGSAPATHPDAVGPGHKP